MHKQFQKSSKNVSKDFFAANSQLLLPVLNQFNRISGKNEANLCVKLSVSLSGAFELLRLYIKTSKANVFHATIRWD